MIFNGVLRKFLDFLKKEKIRRLIPLKKEFRFNRKCVRYPEEEETPALYRGAYFVPEFRLLQLDRSTVFLLGAYEAHFYTMRQIEIDHTREIYGYSRLIGVSQLIPSTFD